MNRDSGSWIKEMDVNFASTTESGQDSVEVDDYSNNEGNDINGEQCGICMDVVIDRGVLDCCQHWFCFECIDNWATITNLCPLCQNEFQLITCVPVYDTIGSSKVDEDSYSRDDDWVIEGKNNSLSFQSYYIDENAVICLDGDGCKIRNGLANAEADSNIDTSIACDSCDIWYHAFCVGFDTESTSEDMWLCPRCVAEEMSQPSDGNLVGNTIKEEQLTEDAYSRKVYVSVADSGETAIVVSMVGDYKLTEVPHDNNKSNVETGEDLKTQTFMLTSKDSGRNVTAQTEDKSVTRPTLKTRELELSLSSDTSCSVSSRVLVRELVTSDAPINDSLDQSSVMGLHLGLSVGSFLSVDEVNEDAIENKTKGVKPHDPLEECIPRAYEPEGNTNGDASEDVSGISSVKRKPLNSGVDSKTGKRNQVSPKKMRTDKANVPEDVKETIPSNKGLKRRIPEKKSGASDIMSIVQGKRQRLPKGINRLNTDGKSTTELEKLTSVRVKKIMKRVDKDNESSIVVQKLRSEIREAVRNKSVKDSGENLFDPKLLEAFRAAVSGPKPDSVKTQSQLSVRAKKSMLQKGNVREKLTKKIYAKNGRRKRAWGRECEVEFWKSRCMRASRPEKIETLNSVLDLLRNGRSESTETGPADPILSRLYLADNSVFPRKEDIKPLATLKSPLDLAEKCLKLSLDRSNSQVSDKVLKPSGVTSSTKVNTAKPSGNFKSSTCKEASAKPEDVKSDKRKWALEVLARRASGTGGGAGNENQGETSALKGSYPLLAQLPVEMRPVLAQSRHNKIPISARQAQLYRLTEHLLRKANLPVIRRTAETELAVVDAVNIERDVANRSNSKPVYLNLCSQELLHPSEKTKPSEEEDSETVCPVESSEQSENNVLTDPRVQEALRNAGFLSDSPPDSPNDTPEKPEEENDNIFEIDNVPDLDIYGEFEYSLDDEDYIGISAAKISRVQPEESASKMKVVFSTLQSEKPESSNSENVDTIETKNDCVPQDSLYGKEGEDPSVAECEELYGPDKEPLLKELPGEEEAIPNRAEKAVSLGQNSSAGECSPNRSEAGETAQNKRKNPKVNEFKQSDNNISKKVEAYVKEHIRPLCKSGVITVNQYRWAVAKATEKVMKYHSKAKNANFLIKEGEKVKKLAEQYVESAKDKE